MVQQVLLLYSNYGNLTRTFKLLFCVKPNFSFTQFLSRPWIWLISLKKNKSAIKLITMSLKMNLLLGQDKSIHISLKWIGNLEENFLFPSSFDSIYIVSLTLWLLYLLNPALSISNDVPLSISSFPETSSKCYRRFKPIYLNTYYIHISKWTKTHIIDWLPTSLFSFELESKIIINFSLYFGKCSPYISG